MVFVGDSLSRGIGTGWEMHGECGSGRGEDGNGTRRQ